MNKTVLALATALLLAGGAATSASAKSHHDNGDHGNNHGNNGHYDRGGEGNSGRHYYKHNYYKHHYYTHRGVRSDNHWDRSVVHDSDHDGVSNHNDNYDDRWDRNRFRYNQQHVYTALRPYSGPRYIAPSGYRYSRWQAGANLPRGYYGDPYYVDYQPYNLPSPPSGYRWNRVGNDVYLVETNNGLISEVVYNLFH